MKDFDGKAVVVTGAASGIGRDTALAFAGKGARLAVCDLNGEGLRAVCSELEAAGCEVYSEIVDVAQAWQVKEFCDNVYENLGRVDLLVNNAGVGIGGFFEDTSLSDWEWIVGVNLWGVVNGCHFFYPRMIAQGGGCHIVNVASAAGLAALPGTAAYNTTKYGVVGLSETLRGEAALHGIGVTVVCPGMINTNIFSSARFCSDTGRSTGDEFAVKVDGFIKSHACPPSRLADQIVRAVEKNRGVVAAGWESKLLDFIHRLSRRVHGFLLRLSYVVMFRWL